MKTRNDPRHQSRIIALQKLFELEFKSNAPFAIADLETINYGDTQRIPVDEPFTVDLLAGVAKHKEEIDGVIRKHTVKRSFEETARIDLLVLRIAVYELLFATKKVPTKVIIDEAVELAKEFGGDKSFTFVNGVLGNISVEHQLHG